MSSSWPEGDVRDPAAVQESGDRVVHDRPAAVDAVELAEVEEPCDDATQREFRAHDVLLWFGCASNMSIPVDNSGCQW